MRDKLEKIIKAYEELEKKLSDPAVASDIKEFTRLNKEYAHQSDLIAASREYIGALDDIEAAKEMLHDTTDADEKEMLQMDISENEEKLPQLEEDIKYMLIPSDPNDDKNTIVEIRSAAGGDEAAIFAGDLYKMYQRFCESRGWKTTVLDSSPSEAGGFKSIEFKVEGDRVYSVMKYESGVHRVQRVPKTESQGRIQTSTATVAVLPEAEEIDVQINQSDLRIDTYCASGPGGQCVNTTYSAVRITHLPTNTVVQSQEQRSQIQNREVCMQMLRARLYEMELEKQQAELGAERQSQIGHGNRSEKIRTYNQPQDRVTDHRIGFNSTYNGVLLGDQLGTVIEALAAAEVQEESSGQGSSTTWVPEGPENSWRYEDGVALGSLAAPGARTASSTTPTWTSSNGATTYTLGGKRVTVSGAKAVGIDVSVHQGSIDSVSYTHLRAHET